MKLHVSTSAGFPTKHGAIVASFPGPSVFVLRFAFQYNTRNYTECKSKNKNGGGSGSEAIAIVQKHSNHHTVGALSFILQM